MWTAAAPPTPHGSWTDPSSPVLRNGGKDVIHLERTRLKNIIIFILLLLNMFLLGTLLLRHYSAESARLQVAREVAELFAADGIALSADTVPSDSAPAVRTPVRSTEEDLRLAIWLLGDDLTPRDEGGGIYTCRGSAGEALFRSSGGFEVRLISGKDNPSETIRRFCRDFGYAEPMLTDLVSGTVESVQQINGCPVVDAVVTFRLEDGLLTGVSGIHLPSNGAESEDETFSAATALTLFLRSRRDSGAVVSAVTDVYPCYRLQTTSASPMTLSPAWGIVTDTGTYYVNCLTGTVSLP